MTFFDKINNYFIVNAIKEILKGRDPEEFGRLRKTRTVQC